MKGVGNAVIPTFPAHCPHGLQHLRHKRPTFAFTGESGYTLGSRRKIAHSGSHAETRVFRTRVVSLPSERFARFGNPAWPGAEWRTLPLSGIGRGALPENAESLRNSDALMCVAVPRRRGPAGLRDLFRFCRNYGLFILHSGLPARVKEGLHRYPRYALRVIETPADRLQKRLTCRFLRSCSHQGISPCPLLSPIGAKQECNNLGAGTAIVRSEQPIANAVGDAVLHGPHHRVIAIAAGRLIT